MRYAWGLSLIDGLWWNSGLLYVEQKVFLAVKMSATHWASFLIRQQPLVYESQFIL